MAGWLCRDGRRTRWKKNPQNTGMMRYNLAMATALTTLGMSGGFPSIYINHRFTCRSARQLQNQCLCEPVWEQKINVKVRITPTQWQGNFEGNNERRLLLEASLATQKGCPQTGSVVTERGRSWWLTLWYPATGHNRGVGGVGARPVWCHCEGPLLYVSRGWRRKGAGLRVFFIYFFLPSRVSLPARNEPRQVQLWEELGTKRGVTNSWNKRTTTAENILQVTTALTTTNTTAPTTTSIMAETTT